MTSEATPGREELLSLIRSAFSEGFNEGGREHTTYGGGKTWAESRALKEFIKLSDRIAAQPADEGLAIACLRRLARANIDNLTQRALAGSDIISTLEKIDALSTTGEPKR